MTSFDGDHLLGLGFDRLLLRDRDAQDAVFVLRLDVFFSHALAHVERAAQSAGPAFAANALALPFSLLRLLNGLFGTDRQIAVLERGADVLLAEARKLNITRFT